MNTQNAQMVYCIDCGEMVQLLNVPVFGILHDAARPVFGDNGEPVGTDQEDCLFPLGLAFCPPPELPADWLEHVTEPGDDESLVIDLQSLVLVEV